MKILVNKSTNVADVAFYIFAPCFVFQVHQIYLPKMGF